MNTSIDKKTPNLAAFITSIPAGLLWIGGLGFLAKWFHAGATGRMEPGRGASWVVLIAIFLAALLACAVGIHTSVRAWRGESQLGWQIASLIGAILVLWAASGD